MKNHEILDVSHLVEAFLFSVRDYLKEIQTSLQDLQAATGRLEVRLSYLGPLAPPNDVEDTE